MPDGIFDPREVYLFGTLAQGECDRGAIAHWSTPDIASTGFGCYDRGGGIDPASGRFVYEAYAEGETELLAFVPDGSGTGEYPDDPYANDLPVGTVCEDPSTFFLDPSGGEIVYLCYSYRYESGEFFDASYSSLRHRGFDGTALLELRPNRDDYTFSVRDRDGVPHRVDMKFDAKALRAHPDGFWVLNGLERWNIGFDGSFSLDGTYPEPPPWSEYRDTCAFEASGAIVCFGQSTEVTFEDHLIRAELGADVAEVVYTEAEEPLVSIHISFLVTGP